MAEAGPETKKAFNAIRGGFGADKIPEAINRRRQDPSDSYKSAPASGPDGWDSYVQKNAQDPFLVQEMARLAEKERAQSVPAASPSASPSAAPSPVPDEHHLNQQPIDPQMMQQVNDSLERARQSGAGGGLLHGAGEVPLSQGLERKLKVVRPEN